MGNPWEVAAARKNEVWAAHHGEGEQMRTGRIFAPIGVCLVIAMAGCGTSTGTGTGTPSQGSVTGSRATSGGSVGPAPTCAVGAWRSTSANLSGAGTGTKATLQGGSGVQLNIDRSGKVQADFTGAQPLTFTATVVGTIVRGEFSYSGPTTGSVRFTTDATSGTWEPYGPVDWSGLRATVKLTSPVAATLLNNANISELTGQKTAQTGNAVDIQPIFRTGTYTCGQNTLTIAPQATGPSITWVFQRP